MAETLVENKICQTCGTEIRQNAQFCYHCGGSVAADAAALKDKKAVSDAWLRENISDGKNVDNSAPVEKTAVLETVDNPIPMPNLTKEPELKSAAAMRRKSKNLQPKRTEIVWEEYGSKPNGWFILAAIVLTLFAVGVFYLMLYLK